MCRLNNNTGPVEEVQRCLQHLHIAIQYLDDIQDFKQDWLDGQFTYAHFLVEKYLRDKQLEGSRLSVGELYQHCFTSGIAQHLLDRSSQHFGQSVAIAHSLGLTELALYVQQQLDGCNIYQHEVAQLLEKTRVKARKSFTPFHAEHPDLTLPTVQTAAAMALRHLQASRDAQGCWLDFLTSAGQSKMWTTAYAGLLLAETKIGLTAAHEAFDASFLLPPSYNEGIMQDGDSTNFSMGLRRKVWGETSPQQISTWLEFMDADGGWVTYRDETRLRNIMKLPKHVSVAAWLTPKLCVTAAAAYVLRLYKELEPQYQLSCRYLARHQHPAGYWNSYWWTSPIYATAFAILALAPVAEHDACREAGLRWLAAQQSDNGAWYGQTNAQQPSAFFTALALKALLVNSSQDYSAAVERGAQWLLSQQMSDGSWLTTRILRVPATDVADPATVKRWRLSSFGTDIEVDDHNRIFTTSTALNALSTYAKTMVALPAYA
ncbi:prenyltransferase/squalene oxidase repeat-containing protein [Hymenobacter metallicola]|nr:prenyltransferase/squalene oxidase repeat-containing protein [Hymenobacter metallicola]